MQYFDNDAATVQYSEEFDAVMAEVHDYIEGEAFRSYMEAILEAVRENDCGRVLSDTQDMGPIAQEDQAWSLQTWTPKAQAAGVHTIAYVMPESVVAKLSVDSVLEEAQEEMDVDIDNNIFDDLSEAKQWLQETATEE